MFITEHSKFHTGKGIGEYHAMIHADDFASLADGYASLLSSGEFIGCHAAMGRIFLNNYRIQKESALKFVSENQLENISIIGQPPLDGSEISLWLHFQQSIHVSPNYHEFRSVSMHSSSSGEYDQTKEILSDYISTLKDKGMTLADNCIRTWLFVNDIDNCYAGFVTARKEVFTGNGLTERTHFIASTGIQGEGENTVTMDAYAVSGLEEGQVRYLKGSSHLSPTAIYGVTFERGTEVLYGDRKHIFISGTASIDTKGNVLFLDDAKAQSERTIENVNILLEEAGASSGDIKMALIYLRNGSDMDKVRKCFDRYLKDTPKTYLLAPVCRPEWLVEMECIAVSPSGERKYKPYLL